MDIIERQLQYLMFVDSVAPNIRELTEPLRKYLNITNFGYLKVFFNGSYFYLCNDTHLSHEYVKTIKDTNIFFKQFLHVSNPEYKFILWPDRPINYSMEIYQRYNYWNGITLVKESEQFLELWWFASDSNNTQINQFFVKNTDVLYKYVLYFQEKTKHMIKAGLKDLPYYEKGIDLSVIKKFAPEDNKIKIKEFLEEIKLDGVNIDLKGYDAFISKREIECLHFVAQALSAKEIANKLAISRRTVEAHLNNIKNKVGAYNKSHLIHVYNSQLKKFFV